VKIIEVDAERRRLSLSLKRVDETDDVQPRADGEPLETPEPPKLALSEEVFPETLEGDGEEAPALEPVAESAPPEVLPEEQEEAPPPEPVAEPTPEIPAAEPELTEAAADGSVEADAVAPDEPGPGDSEGEPPSAPEEAEEKRK
jgi:small subunit ribosomal protein S1